MNSIVTGARTTTTGMTIRIRRRAAALLSASRRIALRSFDSPSSASARSEPCSWDLAMTR